MGEMTLANAKLIMSVVAKRQHELLKSGMSKQDARLKAIEETGQSTYSQASRTCGRLGNQKQAELASRQVMLPIVDPDQNMPISQRFRQICDECGWIPNDKVLAIATQCNSGPKYFAVLRSQLKKIGYVFTELPDSLGYKVSRDDEYERMQEIDAAIKQFEEITNHYAEVAATLNAFINRLKVSQPSGKGK